MPIRFKHSRSLEFNHNAAASNVSSGSRRSRIEQTTNSNTRVGRPIFTIPAGNTRRNNLWSEVRHDHYVHAKAESRLGINRRRRPKTESEAHLQGIKNELALRSPPNGTRSPRLTFSPKKVRTHKHKPKSK
jgi:hypothetical protein